MGGDLAAELAAEIAGRYRIVSALGTGAGGETFEAIDERDGARVALKRLTLATASDWKKVDLFEREARVLQALSHPAIPRLRESFTIGAVSYLAHDFAPGRSLLRWVESGWRPDEAEVVRIGAFLLEVLAYLHALAPAVIHRDVKPANVIRGDDGRLWLVDFGAVRDAATTMTGGSTVVGTYGYMAPEQFRGHAVPASDVYGVGATLLYLLGGKPPTDYPTEKLKIAFRTQIWCSRPLASWIDKALEPAPEDRFRDAREALAVLRGEQSLAQPTAARAPSGRGRLIALLAALGVVVVGAAGVIGSDLVRAHRVGSGSEPLPVMAKASTPETLATLPLRPPRDELPIGEFRALQGRHSSIVYSLAVSSDDKLAATGGDGVVKVWDIAARKETRSLGGLNGKVAGIGFTPSGALVAAGGTTVKIWDSATGTERLSFKSPPSYGLALSRDGKEAFVGCNEGTVRVYRLEDGVETAKIPIGAPVFGMAVSADGSKLAVGGGDGSVRIVSLPSKSVQSTFRPHASTANDVAFAPDGTFLATAGDDRRAVITNLRTDGVVVAEGEIAHADEIWGIAVSPDGKLVVSAGKDKRVSFYDVPARWLIGEARFNALVSHAAFTHDGGTLLIGAGNQVLSSIVARRGAGTIVPEPGPDAAGPPEPRDVDHGRYLELMRMSLEYPATTLDEIDAKLKPALVASAQSSLVWIANAQITLRRSYVSGTDYKPSGVKLAREQLAHAATLGPKGPEWWAVACWVERADRRAPAARDALRQARALGPLEPLATLCEAQLDRADERTTAVRTSLEALIKTTKEPAILGFAYDILAYAYASDGDLDAVEQAHRRHVAVTPKNAWAHGNYARFLIDHGDPEKAIDEAKAALAIMTYGIGRNTLADAHAAFGDHLLWETPERDRALREYDEAIGVAPDRAQAYYGRAAVYRARAIAEHDPTLVPKARADLQKAIKLGSDESPEAKRALAELDMVAKRATMK